MADPQETTAQRRKKIWETLKRRAKQPLHHPHFATDIIVSNHSVKEWFNQPFGAYAEKNEALLQLQSLVDTATYYGSKPDKRGKVKRIHYLKTRVGATEAWIVVKEVRHNEFVLYSISDNDPL